MLSPEMHHSFFDLKGIVSPTQKVAGNLQLGKIDRLDC